MTRLIPVFSYRLSGRINVCVPPCDSYRLTNKILASVVVGALLLKYSSDELKNVANGKQNHAAFKAKFMFFVFFEVLSTHVL